MENGLYGESVPWLWVTEQELLGFFALSMGSLQMRSQHLNQLEPPQRRPTQPAVMPTWIVRSPSTDVDGRALVLPAVALAAEAAQSVAATVLALDP